MFADFSVCEGGVVSLCGEEGKMAHYPTSTQRSKWTFSASVLAEKHDANNRRAVMAVREHYRAAAADGHGAETGGGGGGVGVVAPHRCVWGRTTVVRPPPPLLIVGAVVVCPAPSL